MKFANVLHLSTRKQTRRCSPPAARRLLHTISARRVWGSPSVLTDAARGGAATPAVLLLIASAVAAGSAPLKDSLHHAGSSTESIAVLQRAAWPVDAGHAARVA